MASGATLLAYDGFTFWKEGRKNLISSSQINWYCSSKRQGNCKVTLSCVGRHIVEIRGEHNHIRPVLVTDQHGKYHKFNPPNSKGKMRYDYLKKRGDPFMFFTPFEPRDVDIVEIRGEHNHIKLVLVTHVENIINSTHQQAQLPDWTSIYFVKLAENEIKCNLCDLILKVDEKSLELLEHLKIDHKDVYDLHKDNPEATVGFRIEFLSLNMLKDDGDPKTQPVILGEICEATTEPILDDDNTIQLTNVKGDEIIPKDDTSINYVLIDNSKKKSRRDGTGPRKRSWVWKYFDKLSNIIYRCRLCNVVLSIKGCNSNNMNRHVRTRHPIVFKSEIAKREKVEAVQMISSEDTPYAIKTEEIYASDKDYEEITESPSQKLRRSWIWSYFDRVSSTQAQCKICKRHICHGGNATGNMNRHLKMIHKKTSCSYDQSVTTWVWKVFGVTDDDFYSCKICQYKCIKYTDLEKSMEGILNHLKVEHGVVSGDQIITGADVEGDDGDIM